MPIEPETQARDRKDLAEALRDLRRAAGLSGERLALRCNMSQTKISRIETGRALPTVIDVERILKALAVPDEVADELLSLTRRANVDYASWRAYARVGLYHKQAELKALESSSRVMRHFLPAVPTGLLHVREYAVETLSPREDEVMESEQKASESGDPATRGTCPTELPREPSAVPGCSACLSLVNARQNARSISDYSAASDCNVMLRQHQVEAH